MLRKEDVQWVVNSIGELGVKIGSQFFFMYKGRSLVYDLPQHDDGTPMQWRPIGKREFGECAHPINYTDPSKVGTVSLDDSDKWKVLPCSVIPPIVSTDPLRTALMYLETGFINCPDCNAEIQLADTDSAQELRAAEAELYAASREATRDTLYVIRKHGRYYRPNEQGYTTSILEAGRYTWEQAVAITYPNGPDGPRDGLNYEPAPRGDIPGMRSHVMSGAGYSDDIRSANTKRKRR